MIELFTTRKDFIHYREHLDLSIGFVPTMGNLHAGHLSLVEEAFKDSDLVVVSIFVNPKQFAAGEDLDKYPRTLEQDLNHLSSLLRLQKNKRLCVFAPATIDDIYPHDFESLITIDHTMTKILCAQDRPDHFAGVVTVVHQLFELVRPTTAYFGQKDYQQYLIIKEMIKKYQQPVAIKSISIKRDDDGLALSSRNQYLSADERQQALTLPTQLSELSGQVKRGDLETAQAYIQNLLSNDSNWQYLEILNCLDLSENLQRPLLIVGAYRVGKTRLIDNIVVE